MASICCSPPDMFAAFWSGDAAQDGKQLEQLLLSLPTFGATRVGGATEHQILRDRELPEHCAGLRASTRMPLREILSGRPAGDIGSAEVILPAAVGNRPHSALSVVLLPAPFAPIRAHHLLAHVQIDAMNGFDLAVSDLDAFGVQHDQSGAGISEAAGVTDCKHSALPPS